MGKVGVGRGRGRGGVLAQRDERRAALRARDFSARRSRRSRGAGVEDTEVCAQDARGVMAGALTNGVTTATGGSATGIASTGGSTAGVFSSRSRSISMVTRCERFARWSMAAALIGGRVLRAEHYTHLLRAFFVC
jgi:hypothetical protein